MANIYVTTTAQNLRWDRYARSNYERIVRSAKRSSSLHSAAETPADADIILFVGSNCKFHWDIRRSELYRQNRDKCLLFDLQDNTIPRIPGIYMQIPRYLQEFPIYESGFYPRIFDNSVLQEDVSFSQCRYLFSFVGNVANCRRVRERVLSLVDPRSYLEDASSNQSDGDAAYAQRLATSKFVLCPRGIGPSTWRLFETMRTGRVPVIISDEWVPLKGLSWNELSIRVPENEIEKIPNILRTLENDAERMGLAARRAWEQNFSIEQSFEWIGNACARIQGIRHKYRSIEHRSIILESMRGIYRRAFYREVFGQILRHAGMLVQPQPI